MLNWAAYLLTAAVLAGLGLSVLANTRPSRARVWLPGALHGVVGAAGFALLVAGVASGPVRGAQQGASSFGTAAAGLVAGGLALGTMLAVGRLRAKPPAMLVVALHATLGVAGLVMLAAYLSV